MIMKVIAFSTKISRTITNLRKLIVKTKVIMFDSLRFLTKFQLQVHLEIVLRASNVNVSVFLGILLK